MKLGLLLQYLVIAVAVLLSAWVVLKKQFPGSVRRLRGTLALWLTAPQRAPRLQAWGRKLAPPHAASGDACGGCDNCGPGRAKQH